MSKRTVFLLSTIEPYPTTICDKCGLCIIDIQKGEMYWNPSPNAIDKNICKNCYDVWSAQKQEGYNIWREKNDILKNPKEKNFTNELKILIKKYKDIQNFDELESFYTGTVEIKIASILQKRK